MGIRKCHAAVAEQVERLIHQADTVHGSLGIEAVFFQQLRAELLARTLTGQAVELCIGVTNEFAQMRAGQKIGTVLGNVIPPGIGPELVFDKQKMQDGRVAAGGQPRKLGQGIHHQINIVAGVLARTVGSGPDMVFNRMQAQLHLRRLEIDGVIIVVVASHRCAVHDRATFKRQNDAVFRVRITGLANGAAKTF